MGNCLFLRRGAPSSSGPTPGKTLDEYTWEEISYISSNGLAGEYGFQVGDAKAITLNGTVGDLTLDNYQTYAFIIGINHNAELEGTLLNSLPADLRAVLKEVNKKTSAGSQSTTINTNSMKVFLFAEIEVFGSTTKSAAGEGSQYSYFATAANRIKYLSNGAGSASGWWERSPDASSSNYFCAVYANGDAHYSNAVFPWEVCFGFCV